MVQQFDEDNTPLEFPCRFPIKAMGRAEADIEALVRAVLTEHLDRPEQVELRVSESRNGRFVSVTATITAHSRPQLDAIYRALHAEEAILMTL
ncbi:YbeD family protein [Alkalilimnicola ehrlichii MLHE-1]|uniref:Uncharacterized protein n=1 Tax=Alkalilimnicola ehrlichii (strain ATCC BAA-1101 / DSM 17681 / MLHE-1) TaxID=187272 RepID=Q0ACA4_ALKEH|nr:DUF493 domain-containing protein [Alkalilimnicola ehrlichii]ABI55533.1 protein of unknown function DUF493 [Alkalilimnicola ehrlichii MLHE-1]